MSQPGWETTIYTGNPDQDRHVVEQQRQVAASRGLDLQVQPLQSGGFHVRATPRVQQQAGYGAYGAQAAYAGGGADAPVVLNGSRAIVQKAAADTPERVRYLRKVYGLLSLAAVVAIGTGAAAISLGPTQRWQLANGHSVKVPILVALIGGSRFTMMIAFGVLFVATLGASAVSKVKGLNVIALLGVSALMGLELAPMVFVANVMSGLGHTMSAAPVRDAFSLTGAIFVGITAYVYVTRKDFSYLSATLYMGFWVIFGASILAIFFHSEVFSLAIASVGALLAGGFLLMSTSRIFRTSSFDDAVGDALGLIVQLRNMFMWVLRILMSNRR
jgi:FtsH-binding integral membrane protein